MNLADKLRLIYKPFLVIAVCFIAIYTALNLTLFIQTHYVSLKEDVVNIWLPFILPWIPVYIWLRPRIWLLNLKGKSDNGSFLYQFAATIIIAIPTIIAQLYIETASGKLTQLDTISQIDEQAATKYYSLKTFYIDKQNAGWESTAKLSGKNDQYLDWNLYVTLPILASAEDTAGNTCLAWYGIEYSKEISSRLSDSEQDEEWQKFSTETQSDFDIKDVTQFVYLDRIGNTDEHDGYVESIKKNTKYSGDSDNILVPVFEPYEARTGNKLGWIFGSFGIGALVWLIMLVIPKLNTEQLEKFKSGNQAKDNDWKEMLSILVPRKGFYITPILLDLNVLIFILMVFSGLGFMSFKSEDLLAWGADYGPNVMNGEWWRAVTSMFLHGGFLHLFLNMSGLMIIGIFLEPKLGKTKYLMVYLLTGITASVASLWWHEATVSVGASGAIFGLYGTFLALLLTKVFPKDFSKAFLSTTLIFIGANLVIGFVGVNIDNSAHIGGLVSGFIIGLILYSQLKVQAENGELPDEAG